MDGLTDERTAQIAENARWEFLLEFSIGTDNRVFPDAREKVVYTLDEDWVTHFVWFDDAEVARRGYYRVLSLGARDVRTARRLVSQTGWEETTPNDNL